MPNYPTPEERREAVKALVRAVVETIKEMGEEGAPAGPLYAALMMAGCTLEQFTAIMEGLKSMGVLRESAHVLYFVPKEPHNIHHKDALKNIFAYFPELAFVSGVDDMNVVLYVTYGGGTHQRNNYSKVEGTDISDCYRQIEATCGRHYAFAYTPKGFEGQSERYGLTEIPLQPQVMR